MRSSTVKCDRCGTEMLGAVKIELYRVDSGWSGYQSVLNHRFDLCQKCKAVVDAMLLGVVNSIVPIKEETTDAN